MLAPLFKGTNLELVARLAYFLAAKEYALSNCHDDMIYDNGRWQKLKLKYCNFHPGVRD